MNICYITMYIYTLVVADEKLKELEHKIDNIKWDIVGLGEVIGGKKGLMRAKIQAKHPVLEGQHQQK